jgi:hypothetical protein
LNVWRGHFCPRNAGSTQEPRFHYKVNPRAIPN